MAFNYQREESKGFNTNIPEGKHRIRVKSAEKAVSSKGNDMLTLQFEVSGYNEIVYHYIVDNEYANRNLTQFFDSFKDIPEGELELSKWVGKVGACTIKHDTYNDNIKSKVGYFIPVDKQGGLPAWREPTGAEVDADGFISIPEGAADELPF